MKSVYNIGEKVQAQVQIVRQGYKRKKTHIVIEGEVSSILKNKRDKIIGYAIKAADGKEYSNVHYVFMQPLDRPYEEFKQFLDERYTTIKRNINPKLSPYFKEIIIPTF